MAGQLVLAVPFAFLHDEPHDYYRCRFALRRMLSDFRKVDVTCNGLTKTIWYIFVMAENEWPLAQKTTMNLAKLS
jgi:hypothetical protein